MASVIRCPRWLETANKPKVAFPLFFESHERRLDEISQASLSGCKPPKVEKGQGRKVLGEVNPGQPYREDDDR